LLGNGSAKTNPNGVGGDRAPVYRAGPRIGVRAGDEASPIRPLVIPAAPIDISRNMFKAAEETK
jgi:hypothetical protein